ncbi:MAG: ABC transporter permease subunit [Sulfolobaceae archaeon]
MTLLYLSFLASLISIGRVFVTILISIVTGFLFAYLSIKNKLFENIYTSIIGVFESIPVISFFPIVLLIFVNNIGGELGVEIAVLFLIFTATVWNIWVGIYQSFKTIPQHFIETLENYRLSLFRKFLYLYIPFSIPRIASETISSFTNGIFYITVSEVFTVGSSSYSAFGIGSLITELISEGYYNYALVSLLTLIIIIIPILNLLRFFVNWSVEKFGIDTEIKYQKKGKFRIRYSIRIYNSLSTVSKISRYITEKISILSRRQVNVNEILIEDRNRSKYFNNFFKKVLKYLFIIIFSIIIYIIFLKILEIDISTWYRILGFTPNILYNILIDYIRVLFISILSLFISIFLGYYLLTHPKLEKVLIPIMQSIAAIPAPAYFPFLFLITYNIFYTIFGAYTNEFYVVLLGFISCFYYVFFSYWTGIKNIPYEVFDVMNNLKLTLLQRLKYIFLPSSFPYLISGLSSTINGAWGGLAIGEYWPNIYQGYTLEVKHGLMKLLNIAVSNNDLALAGWASFIFGIIVVLFSVFFVRKLMDVARQKYLVEEAIFIS